MPLHTKRWDDPRSPDDGHRLLVTRYRPRGLAKADETWDAWDKDLAPSVDLHAAAYGKAGRLTLDWNTYRLRYLKEMAAQRPRIAVLAARVKSGETITLLCSSQCTREDRCHRSLLKQLIEREIATDSPHPN
ncbi:MAG: DUF488 domain-containing protein [Phycisphaerae bacterium]